MHGLMMDRPLLLKQLLWRAERVFGDKEIVTRTEAGFHRYTYADFATRVRRLANALGSLGVMPGDRVGTIAWNTYRHFEAYFAVPCSESVLHTVNLRLFPHQVAGIINHADDRVVLFDADQLPLIEEIAPLLTRVKAYVMMTDGPLPDTSVGPLHSYEELLAGASEQLEFPDFDERSASGMCFTSATTGDPKGVLYSHRSTVLHTLALCIHGSIGVAEEKTFLPISPMFHVNSWGIPYACALQGAKIVLPGPHPTAIDYLEAIEHEGVTDAVAAVSVGVMVRDLVEASSREYDLSTLRSFWLGGQAPPRSLMEWWRDKYGVNVPQGWGMTEASPLVTFTSLKSKFEGADDETLYRARQKQGLPLPLVEIRLTDDAGREQPWDGQSAGEFWLRSPWLASEYYDDSRSAESFVDGWFRTGDLGVIDPDGYVQVLDRAKDLIKSGGEWISSLELENALMAHPAIVEATVVAIADERWLERPLACIVTRAPVSEDELRSFLLERFAKWWIPDRFISVAEIPKTGVGKFDKKKIRSILDESGIGALEPSAEAR